MGVNGRPVAPVDVQPAQPMGVAPQPVPTLVNLGQVQGADGSMLVVMQVQTPCGTAVYFFDPATVRQLGVALQKFGSAGDILLPGV